MPIVSRKCPCGRVYDDLVTSAISNASKPVCPSCGASEGQEWLPTTGYFKGDFGRPKDPLEHEALMENRKFQEDLILSGARDLGEFDVKEKGPDEYRPFGNDAFERKRAIENDRVIQPSKASETE